MPSSTSFRILALGDIIGKPGRRALAQNLAAIIKECDAQFVIANGENASGGLGITPGVAEELFEMQIDVLTSGNHIWKHKEVRSYLDSQEKLLRPANYPAGCQNSSYRPMHRARYNADYLLSRMAAYGLRCAGFDHQAEWNGQTALYLKHAET